MAASSGGQTALAVQRVGIRKTLERIVIESAVTGGAGWLFTTVLRWLQMSITGAICGGVLFGIPMFLGIHMFFSERKTKRDLLAMQVALRALQEHPRLAPEPTKITAANAHTVALTLDSASALKDSVTLVSQRLGNPEFKAVAVLHDIRIQCVQDGPEFYFDCSVGVEFVGVARVEDPSPFSLRLVKPVGKSQLAELKVPNGQSSPMSQVVRYEGRGKWDQLLEAVRDSMSGLVFRDNVGPWVGIPPAGTMFCSLEIHLPNGRDGQEHKKSLVRFPFELKGESHQSITVRIDPWAEGASPVASVTRL